VRQPLGELGLDSLMGIEIRNRLEAEVGTKLSATLVWNHPTVADLAGYLVAKLGFAESPVAPVDSPASTTDGGAIAELIASADGLDDDEIIQALMRGATR
jgi:hypothetical protein